MRNSVTISNSIRESGSDVVELTRKRNLFWGRKWSATDIKIGVMMLAVHLLALLAPFMFCWDAFFVSLFMWVLCGIFGITLSFHRNLTHNSFKLPKWLEYIFAYIGLLALQGDPISWVSIHRFHHQFTESEKDPHSPTSGFWFSHMGWMFDRDYLIEKYKERNNVEDLKSQVFYRFLHKTYVLHIALCGAIYYAYGGFTYFVWIMGVSVTWGLHVTFLVNSVCHLWGNQTWDTGDQSKNNWWVAMLTFGEGWHNNHHAFEYSARHGLEWWQIDLCWYMIRFLELLGLATNVKLPTEAHKLKKSFASVKKYK